MQKIEFPSPGFSNVDIPIDDPFVKKLIEVISKIRDESFKTSAENEQVIEEKKTTLLIQFLNVLPYHLRPQEKLPEYIERTKEFLISQFPKSQKENQYLEESEIQSLEKLSKDLPLPDIKIKIIQALTSSIPDLALDLWLGEFSEFFTSSKKFSLSFLDAGVELFFSLISKNQLNDSLVLLSYLSSTEEMTSAEVIASFSLLCQELLKQNHSQSVIQEENQERFEFIAQNLTAKNLNPEHKGLRKLIDTLLELDKQQTVDLILNDHLKQLNSDRKFEKLHSKKPALIKHYCNASLKLKDPSLAIDLFLVLNNHSKRPLEKSDFFHYYEQILQKLIFNEESIPTIEKILKYRISISHDLVESIDLPFINDILKNLNGNHLSVYFLCWDLLCKVLKEETQVTENFYQTMDLLFSKRTVFKNKETNKNKVSKNLKERYKKFFNDIPELSATKRDLLKNISILAKKSQLFSDIEHSSLDQRISEKQPIHQNLKEKEKEKEISIEKKTEKSSPNHYQALSFWLEDFSKFQAANIDPSLIHSGIDLFSTLISKYQFQEALILLSYLSMAKEMTSTAIISCFSVLCEEILKQKNSMSMISKEEQHRFELIAENLVEKALTSEHKGLRKLIDSLSLMNKHQAVNFILNSHLKELDYSFKNFEKFNLKNSALLKHYCNASLKLEDPSLAVEILTALIYHFKHPIEESDFLHYYSQVLSQYQKTLSGSKKQRKNFSKEFYSNLEKILKYRITSSADLIEKVDLPFIKTFLTHMTSEHSSIYLCCWDLLSKILKEKTTVTDQFYETLDLFFSKRSVFRDKNEKINKIIKPLKDKYKAFFDKIVEVNVEKKKVLQNINSKAKKSQFLSEKEAYSFSEEIFNKFYKFQKKHGNIEVNLKVITDYQKQNPLTPERKIEEASLFLERSWEDFQKDKNTTSLENRLDKICNFLNDSDEQTEVAFKIINEFYLQNPKDRAYFFSYLTKKINALIDDPQYTATQKISFLRLYIYENIHIFGSHGKILFSKIFSKLDEQINIKTLFPENYWEFSFLINPEINVLENQTTALQGLFLAVKHLLSRHVNSPSRFNIALELLKHLSLFNENISNIPRIYHIFFKNFQKFLYRPEIEIGEKDSIERPEVTEEDLKEVFNVYDKSWVCLNQTIANLQKHSDHNSEIGSHLISEFAKTLESGKKYKFFINHDSRFFKLLHDTINLSKNWIKYSKENTAYQLLHGEIFAEILTDFEEQKIQDPQQNFVFKELKKHVQFLKDNEFNSSKRETNEIFNKTLTLNSEHFPATNPKLSADVEKQLFTHYYRLSKEEKNFKTILRKTLSLFKQHKINSPQHIHNLFKFVALIDDEKLKSDAWNFFNSTQISCKSHIDFFHYANTQKILVQNNICPKNIDTLNQLNKMFYLIDECFDISNQIAEKIALYKEMISWCQEIHAREKSSKAGVKNVEIYFSLIQKCILELYKHNEFANVDRNTMIEIFTQYTKENLSVSIASNSNIVKVFSIITLANILGIKENIYYIFESTQLQTFFDTFIAYEFKKLQDKPEEDKAKRLKEILSIADSINHQVFLPEDSHDELLLSFYQLVLHFLSTISNHDIYVKVFEWMKERAFKDYEKIENFLQTGLEKKFEHRYQKVYDQDSFDKEIQFLLINLSILFELNYPIEIKKNVLKHFSQIFLKKYILISNHEKMLLLNLCMSLKPTYGEEAEFYEILFTIMTVPIQKDSIFKFECKELDCLKHKETIQTIFNGFISKNTPHDFVRCVNIAKFVFLFTPAFSTSLYISLFDKYQKQIFSSPEMFKIVFNSLAKIDFKKFEIHKNKIFQSFSTYCNRNLISLNNPSLFKQIIEVINQYYPQYQDPIFALSFIENLIKFFHDYLNKKDFVEINKSLKIFFEISFPKEDSIKAYYSSAWANWLRYIHLHFTKIFKITPIESIGGNEVFQSIFPKIEKSKIETQDHEDLKIETDNIEKLKKETLYYCGFLKEFSPELVGALVKKIKSSIDDASFSNFLYISRDVLNYLIENQLEKAISLFNLLLKDKRFEITDRIIYAYNIYQKLDQLISFVNTDAQLPEQFRIDFPNFFNGITNTENSVNDILINLIILLEKRKNLEAKNQLMECLSNDSLKFEDQFSLLNELGSYQQRDDLNAGFIETVHKMICSLAKEPNIKMEWWASIFNLIDSAKKKRSPMMNKSLNEEVIKALFSLPRENQRSSRIWLAAFQKIGNSPEFLSLLRDEKNVDFFFETFESVKPLHPTDQVKPIHLNFCYYFTKLYIQAMNLENQNFNKIEKLTQIKSQILEKFGYLEKEIALLIFELDLKIFIEEIALNPDSFFPKFMEFLKHHLTQFVQNQPLNVTEYIQLIFNQLTTTPVLNELLNESQSEEFRKFILDELISLEDNDIKFSALLSLTNKTFENKLLSHSDRQQVCDVIDSYLYKWLIPGDDSKNIDLSTCFKMAYIYTRYFYHHTAKMIPLIKHLTSHALKELESSKKSKNFEIKTRLILKMIMHNEPAFCVPFLETIIEFYYGNFSSRIFLWFKDFFNYVETNINSLKTLDPSKYWTLRILANIPNKNENKEEETAAIRNNLPPIFEKLNSSGFPGSLRALKILNEYKNDLTPEMLIKFYTDLIKQFAINIFNLNIHDHKKMIHKYLKVNLLELKAFVSHEAFSLTKEAQEILNDTIVVLQQIANKKLYEEKEKDKYLKLIYILINTCIALKEKSDSIHPSTFEYIVKLLIDYPKYYPTKESRKAVYSRALIKLIKRIKIPEGNSKETETSYMNVLSHLNNEKIKEIFSSSAYTQSEYEQLFSKSSKV